MKSKKHSSKTIAKKFRAVGADIQVFVVARGRREEQKALIALKKVNELFLQKQKVFDRFNPQSELSRLNSKLGKWQKTSSGMCYLAKRALFYNRESRGLYDPRVIGVLEKIGYKSAKCKTEKLPRDAKWRGNLSADLKIRGEKVFFGRRMDFSGIAKGYIVDLAAEFLKERNWRNFFINAAGDAYAAGFSAAGGKWKLPIEGARGKDAFIFLSDQAAATSGVTKKRWRYSGKDVHHLINPKNPNKFSFGLRSVIVTHKKTEWADGRAKVLMLMRLAEGFQHAKKKRLRAIFVDKKGKITRPNQRD